MNQPESSIPPPAPSRASPSAGAHRRMGIDEIDGYRERIRENIGYDLLLLERPYDAEEIDGYVELMAETVPAGGSASGSTVRTCPLSWSGSGF